MASKVTGSPGDARVWLAAREIPSQLTLTWFEASAELSAGIWAPGGVMNAANVWSPEVAAYATLHWLDCGQDPTSVWVV